MTCPICACDTVQTYRPFCSKHCANLDLGKWLTGAYAVPSRDLEDTEIVPEDQPPGPQTKH